MGKLVEELKGAGRGVLHGVGGNFIYELLMGKAPVPLDRVVEIIDHILSFPGLLGFVSIDSASRSDGKQDLLSLAILETFLSIYHQSSRLQVLIVDECKFDLNDSSIWLAEILEQVLMQSDAVDKLSNVVPSFMSDLERRHLEKIDPVTTSSAKGAVAL